MKDIQLTKKVLYTTASCCLAVSLLAAGFSMNANGANYEAEVPAAGISVILNNYYARTSNDDFNQVKRLSTPVVSLSDNNTSSEEETEAPEETESPEETEAAAEEPSEYENVAVSRVNDYVNVRTMPSTDSEIVGKIYDGCAATILERVDDWYRIESGNVEGYIKAEYFVTGAEAEALSEELANKIGTVNTTTLRVRAGADIDSDCVTMVPLGEEFMIMEEENGWAKIEVDASTNGWVSMEFLDVRVEFDVAVSVEEERAKLEEQEALKRKAEEDRAALVRAQAAAAEAQRQQQAAAAEAPAQPENSGSEEAPAPAAEAPQVSVPDSASNAALREAVVSYGLQFVGRPYVYGGNSLTNGTDCSGFVKLIYQEFGYNIARRASLQYNEGHKISVDAIQPGDLVFYGNGEVDHVTMYIGNGQVVHASTERTGIKISSVNYRTIYGAISVID